MINIKGVSYLENCELVVVKSNSKMRLGSLLVCVVLSVGFAEELPWFIKKCSLKDPELYKCIITNGNLAIPELARGSSFLGIPPATPLHISLMNLPGTDFTVTLSNVRLFGIENVRMIDASFDTQVYRGKLLMTVPYLNLTADYIVVSNDVFFPRILESGKLHTALAENIFRYDGKANIFSREGKIYLNYTEDGIIFRSKRILYRYSDLQFISIGNYIEFLNVHKRIIDERIKPGVSEVLHKYITPIAVNLLNKLPKDYYLDD